MSIDIIKSDFEHFDICLGLSTYILETLYQNILDSHPEETDHEIYNRLFQFLTLYEAVYNNTNLIVEGYEISNTERSLSQIYATPAKYNSLRLVLHLWVRIFSIYLIPWSPVHLDMTHYYKILILLWLPMMHMVLKYIWNHGLEDKHLYNIDQSYTNYM